MLALYINGVSPYADFLPANRLNDAVETALLKLPVLLKYKVTQSPSNSAVLLDDDGMYSFNASLPVSTIVILPPLGTYSMKSPPSSLPTSNVPYGFAKRDPYALV